MKRIIYQVLPRLWGRGKMSDWDSRSLGYLKDLGVDYIWYTGIPRHASGKSFVKGDPGSPYCITDWKDVNPYLADREERRLDEFRDLVRRTHASGLKCLVDFVPNHVARDYEGPLRHFDHCDYDWTDTLKLDWSDSATLAEAVEILRFWALAGVDGFRCDMVELVPLEAQKRLISSLKSEFPELLFVAEAYGRENYGAFIRDAGYDLLYDKSGAYDILRSVTLGRAGARNLTWNWQFLGDLQPNMLNFLENHDEQRAASEFFAGSAARTYAALAFALLFNDASFMLYFGEEVGEDAAEGAEGRTSIFNWAHPAGIGRLKTFIDSGKGLTDEEAATLAAFRELLSLAGREVFRRGSTWDLCYCQKTGGAFNPDRHFAFLRYTNEGEAYGVVCNFSGETLSADILVPPEPLGRTAEFHAEAAPWSFCVISLNNI